MNRLYFPLYEEINIPINVKALRDHLREVVFPAGKPVLQGVEYGFETFGGWSLQSHSGKWTDGWEITKAGQQYSDQEYKELKARGCSHPFEHYNQTELCTGYVKELIDTIDGLGFYPRRARVTISKQRTFSIVHRDALPHQYGARIHIPIVSTTSSQHETEFGNFHMEPGKCYIIWVNNLHRIANYSPYDRYHIIMDTYDTKHVTNNFQYDLPIEVLLEQQKEFRRRINEC